MQTTQLCSIHEASGFLSNTEHLVSDISDSRKLQEYTKIDLLCETYNNLNTDEMEEVVTLH